MSEINPLVLAHLRTLAAKAEEAVAKLEAQYRAAPVNTGTTWTAVNLSKKLTEAKSQADSWRRVYHTAKDAGQS